jgi:hypothetical protein
MLISSFDPTAVKPDAAGYVQQSGALVAGYFIHVANMTTAQAEDWCTASATCVAFTFACNDTDSSHMKNACTATEEAQVRPIVLSKTCT